MNICRWLVVLLLLLSPFHATAASFPERPVILVVGNTPGSAQDVFARELAKALEAQRNINVVVENKPGGDALIGLNYLKSRPADGYAIGLFNITQIEVQIARDESGVGIEDFGFLGGVLTTPVYLFVKADGPYKTLGDVVKQARARPGELSIGGAGGLSILTLMTRDWTSKAGIEVNYVPYKGGNESLTAVLGGFVDAMETASQLAIPYLNAGKLRALAQAGQARDPVLPDVPTFSEQGLDTIAVYQQIMVIRAGTPVDRTALLAEAINKAVESPEIAAFARNAAATASYTPGAEIKARVTTEVEDWRKAIKTLK